MGNDTVFHPQGGGQPTDKGMIQSIYHDLVCHFGAYSTNNCFKIGQTIKQQINENDRKLYAKLHTSGHLIDIGMNAVANKLNIRFEAIKGYHFPKGAYVEYVGNLPLEQRSAMKQLLQNEMDSIINNNQSLQIQIKMMPCNQYLDDVAKLSNVNERKEHMLKMKICKESMVRVMSVPGFEDGECMCGGTHIDRIGRIKKLTITKFKKKGKHFRVSYKVE